MAALITFDECLRLRLRGQGLLPSDTSTPDDVAQVAIKLCGIQAQEVPAAALVVRPRGHGLTAADVHQARVVQHSVVRTWAQRGTLHLLAAADLHWLLALLGPSMVASGHSRRLQLGLDDATYEDALRLVKRTLAEHGPLTRAALFERLGACGVHLEGQARPHLLSRAALDAIICFGPDHGTEPTYVLLDDWLPRPDKAAFLPEDEAHAELTRRYLAAYGPATPQDQAAWSGLPLGRTRVAWQQVADELVEVAVEGQPAWLRREDAARLAEAPAAGPNVRLLPRYDVYLLGYQNRNGIVPEQYQSRVNAGGGIVHPIVLVDGQVVGTWSAIQQRRQVVINITPFTTLAPRVEEQLMAEVMDLGRFLGMAATGHVAAPRS